MSSHHLMESLMNRIVLSTLVCLFLGTAGQAQAPNAVASPDASPDATPILVGAYVPAPVDAPVVQEARNYVQSFMVSMALGEVTTAYVQIVNGTNVKLICTATEEGRQASWLFVVYHSLDNNWHFTLAQHL